MIVTDYKPEEKIIIDIENNKNEIIKANSSLSITPFNMVYGTMSNTVDFFMDGGVISTKSTDQDFKYSDHNPVTLKFRLK